jgi:hypothetical protein
MINNVARNNASARIHRWVILLSQLDFDIVHVPGITNLAADALSNITKFVVFLSKSS